MRECPHGERIGVVIREGLLLGKFEQLFREFPRCRKITDPDG